MITEKQQSEMRNCPPILEGSVYRAEVGSVCAEYPVLDVNGILEMYEQTYAKGKFQRIINEKMSVRSSLSAESDKILITPNFSIAEDEKIRDLIENIGLELINEGKWKEIILVHKNASGHIAISAKYNLVLGIANFYIGNFTEALSFLRTAINLKSELNTELQNHLYFFDATVKHSIGILSDKEYNIKISELEGADNIGLYIRLETAKAEYMDPQLGGTEERYIKYFNILQETIKDPKSNENIVLNAKCELILYQGFHNNFNYLRSVTTVNALEDMIGPNFELRIEKVKEFMDSNRIWYENVQDLKIQAANAKNSFAYYTAVINEVKVSYQFQVFLHKVQIVQKMPNKPDQELPNKVETLDKLLNEVDEACNYFKSISHIENVIASLSTKFEILHYLERFDAASIILAELESLIETYDLIRHKIKLSLLKNKGTTHETFIEWIDGKFEEARFAKNEYEIKRDEMIKMDEEERQLKKSFTKKDLTIFLFPIGYFQFPKSKKSLVYDILNIKNQPVRKTFDIMFEKVIPVANIYYDQIDAEGYLGGNLANRGIDSWRNIYRIRKAFYDNNFYRNENI